MSAILSAQTLVEVHKLDCLTSAHSKRWGRPVEYAEDPEKGNVVIMRFPPNSVPGGLDMLLGDWAPKFDEWDELRFDYNLQGFETVMGKRKLVFALTDLPPEILREQQLEIALIIDTQDFYSIHVRISYWQK